MQLSRTFRIGLWSGVMLTLMLLIVTVYWQSWSTANMGRHMQGEARPGFALPDLNGQTHRMADWDGQVVLLNFWATWCPPCQQEIPDFIEAQAKYEKAGLRVVGIAVDTPEAVREFQARVNMNYPVLVGQLDASALARQYGNQHGILPYNVLVDRDGIIRHVEVGRLTENQLEQLLARWL